MTRWSYRWAFLTSSGDDKGLTLFWCFLLWTTTSSSLSLVWPTEEEVDAQNEMTGFGSQRFKKGIPRKRTYKFTRKQIELWSDHPSGINSAGVFAECLPSACVFFLFFSSVREMRVCAVVLGVWELDAVTTATGYISFFAALWSGSVTNVNECRVWSEAKAEHNTPTHTETHTEGANRWAGCVTHARCIYTKSDNVAPSCSWHEINR